MDFALAFPPSIYKFGRMKIRFTTWIAALAVTFLSGSGLALAQTPEDVMLYPTNTALLPGRGAVSKWHGLAPTWASRQADFAKTAPNEHGAVVFLGDSITQGWKSLAQDFPDLKVANRGISGDTTRGVLYRLDADVLSLDPKAVVLLIGTNDIGAGGNPADTAYNIGLILKQMRKKYPHMPIIVCEVMPSSEKQHRPPATIEELNRLIKKDVRWHSHVYLCDTWSMFAQPDGDAPKAIFPDLLHPNASGYATWTAALKPIFAKAKIETTE
jgi:lysophospholipase L1-like esterase